MEDLLILIIQGTCEFLFELFSWLPWDWMFGDFPTTGPTPGTYIPSSPITKGSPEEQRRSWLIPMMILSVLAGGVLGSVSTYVFPTVIVRFGWLRIALLFASPIGSGLIACAMARRRQRGGRVTEPGAHFWLSLCFSAGVVWVRFAYAHRT